MKYDNLIVSPISPFVSNEENNAFIKGGNFLATWERNFLDGSNFRAQFYYDRENKDFPNFIRIEEDTYDLDVQHQFNLTERQELI
jgi:iron complex outermembrane recepter protein